jgi:hypothetical protein
MIERIGIALLLLVAGASTWLVFDEKVELGMAKQRLHEASYLDLVQRKDACVRLADAAELAISSAREEHRGPRYVAELLRHPWVVTDWCLTHEDATSWSKALTDVSTWGPSDELDESGFRLLEDARRIVEYAVRRATEDLEQFKRGEEVFPAPSAHETSMSEQRDRSP